MAEEIDPKTGLKIRKITELKANAAEEYQDAMMHRVKELHVQDNKVKGVVDWGTTTFDRKEYDIASTRILLNQSFRSINKKYQFILILIYLF